MEWKNKQETVKGLWGRYKGVLLILLAGVILLSWPEREQVTVSEQSSAMEKPEETEARMEKILQRIEGVGQLKLMLTVESSVREELAVDTDLSYRGTAAVPDEYSCQTETVIVSEGQDDVPVVAYRVSPVYRGAVVVCQGAENAGVRLAVTQAVAALTGLRSDRIMVIKCQS